MELSVDGKPFAATIVEQDEACRILRIRVNDKEFKIGLESGTIVGGRPLDVTVNEVPFRLNLDIAAAASGTASRETALPKVESVQAKAGRDETKVVSRIGRVITPPMPGKVIAVRVKEGDTVRSGDVVLILEAMKMANEIKSPYAGKVKEVRVSTGQSVAPQDTLIAIE
jgi:biotin carboxyl carrier protein